MDNIRKLYVDSRYNTSDSIYNSDCEFKIKEGLDLPDNTLCYIDATSIPHKWHTIEYYNNKMYIEMSTLSYSLTTVPRGNYTTSSLVSIIESLLQTRFPDYGYSCIYNHNVGTFKITNSNDLSFRILTDEMVISLQGATYGAEQTLVEWYGNHVAYGLIGTPDFSNLRYMKEVFRNSLYLPAETFYEGGFIDLLNVRNIYIHSPNLGHYNSIGVRGESSIIKKYQFLAVWDI